MHQGGKVARWQGGKVPRCQGAKACYNVMKYANFGPYNSEDILIAYRWKFPLSGQF